jgi:hypothetical protein
MRRCKLSSIDILSEISEFMGMVQEMNKGILVRGGHITVTVGYTAARPDLDADKAEKVLTLLAQYISLPIELLPEGSYFVDFIRVSSEIGDSRFEQELKLPVYAPSRQPDGEP